MGTQVNPEVTGCFLKVGYKAAHRIEVPNALLLSTQKSEKRNKRLKRY